MLATRLTDLFPRWVHPNMFAFLCPHCGDVFLTCKNIPMDHDTQYELFDRVFYTPYPGTIVVGCKESYSWVWQNAHDFEQITVTPSLDASASGHWHGFISAGAIA